MPGSFSNGEHSIACLRVRRAAESEQCDGDGKGVRRGAEGEEAALGLGAALRRRRLQEGRARRLNLLRRIRDGHRATAAKVKKSIKKKRNPSLLYTQGSGLSTTRKFGYWLLTPLRSLQSESAVRVGFTHPPCMYLRYRRYTRSASPCVPPIPDYTRREGSPTFPTLPPSCTGNYTQSPTKS